MLVIVCPGQGSQTPGFLAPWMELPTFAARMPWLSAAAGMDLVAHGTTSDAATIKDTAVAQPLIVASGMLALLELFPHPSDAFEAVAFGGGHSVGEITAAAAAGVITAEQAMVFVRERGRTMAEAAAVTETGMSAVVGGDETDVIATIEKHGLTAANRNGAGQIVAAGTMEQLAALKEDGPAKARVIPLPVAGAFHTHHMAPAVDTLEAYSRAMTTHDPRTLLVSNADGHVVHNGQDVLRRLVAQVSQPVRWDLCMETFKERGVQAIIEIPPAGTLTNLAKRALPGVKTLALKTPEDLPAARELVKEFGASADVHNTPTWRLLVAPAKGTVRIQTAGDTIKNNDVVATIEGLRDSHPVAAQHDGTVVEWLVEEGDPVRPGQPLVRLHPTSSSEATV